MRQIHANRDGKQFRKSEGKAAYNSDIQGQAILRRRASMTI
jgi:hypothetical protein